MQKIRYGKHKDNQYNVVPASAGLKVVEKDKMSLYSCAWKSRRFKTMPIHPTNLSHSPQNSLPPMILAGLLLPVTFSFMRWQLSTTMTDVKMTG